MEALPEWHKHVAASKARMEAYDKLPAEIRLAISFANTKFDVQQMLDLWRHPSLKTLSQEQRVVYLLKAVRANDASS